MALNDGALANDADFRRVLGIANPLSSVAKALEAGESAAMIWQGDSTSDESTEMAYLLFSALAAKFPDIRAQYKAWSDGSQAYGAWQVLQSGASGERYIDFVGTEACRWSASYMAVTGDPDIAVKILPATYTPASFQTIFSRDNGSGTYSQKLYLRADGKLQYAFSQNGASFTYVASTVALPYVAGTPMWVRATHKLNNGAGGNDVKFYTSSDGATWTQLGTTVTNAGTATIYDPGSAVPWEIGAHTQWMEPYIGKIYEVVVRNGIDGPVMSPQPVEAWQRVTAIQNSVGGSPTLYFLNGSTAGKSLSYFLDTTRHPLIVEPYEIASAIVVNDGHNEGALTGRGWYALLDSLKTANVARAPCAGMVVTTQNPEVVGTANWARDADRRARQTEMWAIKNGVYCADTYIDFMRSGVPLLTMIPDGVHPTGSYKSISGNNLIRGSGAT